MMDTEREFFKMSAAGNDFIAFDNRGGDLRHEEMRDFVPRICSRSLSVGGDGVLLLEGSTEAHLRVSFFNPDGGATFCGNGARCAARLAYLKGIAPARMTVQTDRMVHRAEVRGNWVSFEMQDPRGLEQRVVVESEAGEFEGTVVDTGVPHFVLFTQPRREESIERPGRAIRHHPRFAPAGVNVDFVRQAEDGALLIRTYERGVEGETLACGTGCVAAALAAAAAGMVRPPVRLRTRSGAALRVLFEGDPHRAAGVRLEGEARLVYVGQLTDEAVKGFTPCR